jgi:hypothetical protein
MAGVDLSVYEHRYKSVILMYKKVALLRLIKMKVTKILNRKNQIGKSHKEWPQLNLSGEEISSRCF